MNLSPRELTNLAAALLFWREEMTPHGRWIMRPYFSDVGAPQTTPLNRRELRNLAVRLRGELTARK